MKKVLILTAFAILTVGILIGCNKKMAGVTQFSADRAAAPRSANFKAMATSNASFQDYGRGGGGEAKYLLTAEESSEDAAVSVDSMKEGRGEEGKNKEQEKKLIKDGSVTLEVESLENTEEIVEKWARSLGGYIESSGVYEKSAFYLVKVPCDKFDTALNTTGKMGVLKERSFNSQDVTEQYYDLYTRLNNKKVMKTKLENYLKQAKDVKDMLQIEVELNNTISEIENMEGRMKRLNNQIDYSSISINFRLPYGKTATGGEKTSLKEGIRIFITNLKVFFPRCLTVFLYIIIFGIPILAFLAFLFWLLWGRVGLLKKLYKWLSK